MTQAKQITGPTPYASCEDFCRVFDEDMNSVYHLAFLLTADDFQVLRPYIRESRRTLTPSLHAASIRFPVSLKPARPFISSRTAGAVSATASLMRSRISFCSR